MAKKTKILAIGDIHGDKGLVKKLAETAEKENVDFIILAGDLTLGESSTEGLIGPFSKINKPVLIIPGNHESTATIDFLSERYDNAKNIHGYGIKSKGGRVGFFGAGTANMGIHAIPDEEIFEMLEKSHGQIKDAKKKVMVTHIHPEGSKSEMFGGFPGSSAVRRALEKFKPDFLVNAHIHEAGGIEEKIAETTVFNVSKKAKIFKV
jgi:Icc-related predicted phosphoesterase